MEYQIQFQKENIRKNNRKNGKKLSKIMINRIYQVNYQRYNFKLNIK